MADRAASKTPYIVVPALLGAICLVLSAVIPNHGVQFAFLCIAAAGIIAGQPVFWSLPSRFLKGAGAAAGLWIKDNTGRTIAPMFFLAACLAAAALLVHVVGRVMSRTQIAAEESGPVQQRAQS
jgi:hypothetical protein